MSSLKPYEIGKEVEDILGEAVDLWEAEGRSELTLTRRAREALDRIEAWRDRPSGEGMESAEPESNEAEEMWAAQRAALERIASGVRPSGGDSRGLTMLTVREARSIAQNALHLSEDRASGKQTAKREAAHSAERLRARALSGDLEGAKREARRILGRNETLDTGDRGDTLRAFAQTLLGLLEGKVGLDVRRAATFGSVRREREAREDAERRVERIEQEAAVLRRALGWYAEQSNYRLTDDHVGQSQHSKSVVQRDGGQKAREVLEDTDCGREVARQLGAAEEFVQRVRTGLDYYEEELAKGRLPAGEDR
jgi:hypothetical protein